MRRASSLEKTLMLGKTEGKRRRGWQTMRCLDGIINSMDMSLSKRQETVGQESLTYCTPRGCKESDMAENLNNRQQHKEYTAKYGMKRKRKLVAQSCLTLCDPMNYSPSGTSVHGILQARILEWVAIPFSKGFSQSRDWTQVSCTAGRFFTNWVIRKAPNRDYSQIRNTIV